MAGHSKWANIQHRKGRQDKLRAKVFSKLSKEITIAAKMGEPDPDKNPRLRLAIRMARSNSVPRDTIERAIKRGCGFQGDQRAALGDPHQKPGIKVAGFLFEKTNLGFHAGIGQASDAGA